MASITSSRCCYLFTIVFAGGVDGVCDRAGMCSRRALDLLGLVLPSAGQSETLHQHKLLEPCWNDIIRMDKSCTITYNKSNIVSVTPINQSILSWSVFFSVHRRARTTSQRRKRITTIRHPTSSTIIFIIIKRTNAETITIILPWQKRNQEKKHSHWKSSSFKTNLLWLYIVNVMLLM